MVDEQDVETDDENAMPDGHRPSSFPVRATIKVTDSVHVEPSDAPAAAGDLTESIRFAEIANVTTTTENISHVAQRSDQAVRLASSEKWDEILQAMVAVDSWTPRDLLPVAERLGYRLNLNLAKVQIGHFIGNGTVQRIARGLYRVAPPLAAQIHRNEDEG